MLRLVVVAATCAVRARPSRCPIQAASAERQHASDYVARINALRASVGVQPLVVDAQLTGLAQGWAQHMAATGRPVALVADRRGHRELGQARRERRRRARTTRPIWNAFLHSAEHYANLVDPAFNRVGVGRGLRRHGPEWTCHKFMELVGGQRPARRPAPRHRCAAWPRWSTPSAPVSHATSHRLDRQLGLGRRPRRPTTTTTAPPAPAARSPAAGQLRSGWPRCWRPCASSRPDRRPHAASATAH